MTDPTFDPSAGEPQANADQEPLAPPAPSEPEPAPAADSGLAVGALVDHTYFDAYRGAGGEDVTVRCLVVDVVDVDVQDPDTLEFRTVKGARLLPLDKLTDPVTDGITAV